jgi:acetolactate synthase-1/2/3 large subunit
VKKRGSLAVRRALEDEGVSFTFGIPGTHNIELYDALAESKRITPVLVTDEQSASFMADGVSRSSGEVGVVNLVPGAGVTHALSGIAEAYMDTVPLVVLACGIRNDTGMGFQLHDVDQAALLAPVTKAVISVSRPMDVYPSVRRAFALARAGAPGPVAVEVPANFYLLTQEVGDLEWSPDESPTAGPDPGEVEEAARLLVGAKRPVLYVGMGAARAADAVVELAERLAAPVATTISGKGAFPESHPLFLWNSFGAAAPGFVRSVMKECDCMLAVGCRFGEVATGSYGATPPPNLIHVDIEPAVLGRNYPARLAVASDAGAFLRSLLERVATARDSASLEARIRQGHEETREAGRTGGRGERVSPYELFSALQELCGEDAIYVTDSGNGTFLAMENLRLNAPGRFLAPVDYSCMGYSVPAAIGAKLANPRRDVVALPGDGALLMTGLELLTAAAYRAAPLVCVLNDGELAQIAQFQRTALNRATCAVLPPYEIETLARAAGCRFVRIVANGDLRSRLAEALALTRAGIPVMAEVAIDYSARTFFTKGVVKTNLWRLPWVERLRLVGRAISRRLPGGVPEA